MYVHYIKVGFSEDVPVSENVEVCRYTLSQKYVIKIGIHVTCQKRRMLRKKRNCGFKIPTSKFHVLRVAEILSLELYEMLFVNLVEFDLEKII